MAARLSHKIQAEIEALDWFIPTCYTSQPVTDSDKQAFADWSSRGTPLPVTPGTQALKFAKTMREYHIGMWKQDIREKLITLQELYEGMPEVVQRYVNRSLGVSHGI